MAALPAHLVATPVLERVDGERSGAMLGAGTTAAWVDLDGFVVAVTTREVPLLPNAVALGAGSGVLARPGLAPGTPARLLPGRIELGPLQVTWDPAGPPVWDPTVPVPAAAGPEVIARRGQALADALEAAPGAVDSRRPVPAGSATLPEGAPIAAGEVPARPALGLLLRAVRERDPGAARAAARALEGRGPGLTPEGDDLLAAVAGTLAVAGPVTGVDGPTLSSLLAALAPLPGRTTALSATLFDLAAHRKLPEPAGRLLDFGAGAGAEAQGPGSDPPWLGALERLVRLGHGSGRAYAVGIAATLTVLAAGRAVR